jgi:hypothetical protein
MSRDKVKQIFVEERTNALEELRVFFVACARAEVDFEHGFQNQLAKVNRRARRRARRHTVGDERVSVLARGAPSFVEQVIAPSGFFDERDDARQQLLTELALLGAFLFSWLRFELQPIAVRVCAQL